MGTTAHTEKRRRAKARPAAKPPIKKSRRVTGSKHQRIEDPRQQFSDDEWHEMVAEAAYYRAEARGFEAGSPEDDWYEAEAELREQLAGSEEEAMQSAAEAKAPESREDVER
ncbi:MAG TPA: DUF2934 domain-containing protein [Burkholderiales bacterium]|nr:DUF2934 domain-containing protein [Burkholderiales bacterium]